MTLLYICSIHYCITSDSDISGSTSAKKLVRQFLVAKCVTLLVAISSLVHDVHGC
jgi:hypothetical protein